MRWHCDKEGLLAFGTEDGLVGIYNVLSKRSAAALSWNRDSQTVMLYSDNEIFHWLLSNNSSNNLTLLTICYLRMVSFRVKVWVTYMYIVFLFSGIFRSHIRGRLNGAAVISKYDF